MHFKIFWNTWNRHSYSRECLQYWVSWHLVIEMSSSTVKNPEYTLEYSLLLRWKYCRIWQWSCLSKATDYENSIPRVAQQSNIPQLPSSLHNTGWMEYCQVHNGRYKAILILDPVDGEKWYSYSASHHYCLQWLVLSHGWHYGSFGWEDDTMEGRLILCHEGCVLEALQTLCWSHSKYWSVSHFSTYPLSFPEVAII